MDITFVTTDEKDIREPPSYVLMEHFLTSTNLHAIGGIMLIAPMLHPFTGQFLFATSC
ncbi:hypothetical protein X777_00746 [Ooceraea biroi]|uniref:Uncharacterized protein n=1 Tax=Ooceraea biroi TaxID=2015173 RepID=A0A026WPS9_OOCBI|nr:hypothetical protein X777_00746 [Ooceraea biroi]